MSLAILIIDDEPTLVKNIRAYLARHGHDTESAGSAEEGLELLDRFQPDVVLLDFHLPGINGLEALGRIRERRPDAKVVMITGHSSVKVAVDAMKAGAYDYVAKPVVLGELKLLLDRAAGQDRIEHALDYYTRREGRDAGAGAMVGESPGMRELKETIGRLLEAETRMTTGAPPAVLVVGETGTGKELVARALHFGGQRARKPFIEMNCASIPTHLLESELFGHERGAFTDARTRRAGLAEAAQGGTLFLDEIGDTDPAIQAKLLKLIEEKSVRRLGSVRDTRVDVRIVAATHQPLEERICEGRFRADLFYRLRGLQLRVPALRERGDDIVRLARHFLAAQGARYGRPGLALSPQAEALLLAHPWPGNVRELRNVVEEAVLLARTDVIGPGDLGAFASQASPMHAAAAGAAIDSGVPAAIPDEGIDLEQIERSLVEKALAKADGNVTRAARLLNLSRDTMRYRLEKFGLSPAARAQEGPGETPN
ncbi:MAG: sigma-54 dependent transcriptional regulator [Burkholderiales bacterium]|nr:sigma-54 dependent transcriptional regulator [Burkholderiales bacterium]